MKKAFLLFIFVLLISPAVLHAQGTTATVTTTTTTTEPVATTTTTSSIVKAKNWIDVQLAHLEAFREEQALKFAWMRYNAKQRLGITGVARDGTPELPPATPAKTPTKEVPYPSTTPDLQSHPADYVTLIYSTALASFFGTKPLFYIILVVLVLFILRQLFRWIF